MATVLVACDKFKGSLTVEQVGEHIDAGIRSVAPDTTVTPVLVADGGDGTLHAALHAGFEERPLTVQGPTGEPVDSAWALRGTTALVEMADLCGLMRLPGGVLRGMEASSYGLGQAMVAALDAGATELVVGIGGSASTDGGAGMLQALGARLLDADGREVGRGVRPLGDVVTVDLAGLHPRLSEVTFTMASDVNNPLLGDRGTAAIFGPQKGVGEAEHAEAEACLTRFADAFAAAIGRDERDTPGAGAAGGVGYALLMLGATMRPGIAIVLELAGFDDLLADADLVITGEGSLDEQTLLGKTPAGVTWAARQASVPVVAVCGRALLDPARAHSLGIERVYALTDLEPDPTVCMRDAGPLLERLAAVVAREQLG